MNPLLPLRTHPITPTWQVTAGARSRFPIYLDTYDAHSALHGTVGGIPTSWAKMVHKGAVIWVEMAVPPHTSAGHYPFSLTLADGQEPRKRTTIPITLEILSTPSHLPAFPRIELSPAWLAMGVGFLVVAWLGFSYWRGAQPNDNALSVTTEYALESIVPPPLAQIPVVIGAEWQAELATPTVAPTPTLRPTPTPLPPLPTPQPPPELPPEPLRAVEGRVDGPYTYEHMFQEVGSQFGVDWRLLASIARRESDLRPDAIGGSGEEGMMQMMPDTWNEFAPRVGESDPFNAYSSTRVAAYYLVYLRDYLYSQGYTESYWLLVAYNWGPNNLRRHLADGGDWGSIPALRQNYAYTIVNRVNDANDSLWTTTIQQEVPQ